MKMNTKPTGTSGPAGPAGTSACVLSTVARTQAAADKAGRMQPAADKAGSKPEAPSYLRPLQPHNNRRAAFHDYKAPGYYLITIRKATSAPPFSFLSGDPKSKDDPPCVILQSGGCIIAEQIAALCQSDSRFEIDAYVIMPDHVHLLWRVKEWLPRDMGHFIAGFKAKCAKSWHEAQGIVNPDYKHPDFFAEKFNDRIAFDAGMVARFKAYIADNPRRRLMVMKYPGLFSSRRDIRILDRTFTVYGNFQLLRNPMVTPAIFSSRYTAAELSRWHRLWDETIRTEGVLISPFIHPEEKKLMDRAIDEGASIIRIIPEGIGDRYKPSGHEFDLAAEGRCLHIGSPRPSAHKEKLTRRESLFLNDIARWIASNCAALMSLLH